MQDNEQHIFLQERVVELKNELENQQQLIVRFKRVFESIPDGVLCTDYERRIIMVNPAMQTLLGYTEKELLGRQTHFLYSCQEDYEKYGQRKFDQNSEIESRNYELKFRKKDTERNKSWTKR